MASKSVKARFPIAVEVVPYRHENQEGSPGKPITEAGIGTEQGDRVCVARVLFKDARGAKGSIFVTLIQGHHGKFRVEMNQDQTDYNRAEGGFHIARKEMPLKFYLAEEKVS